MAPLETTVNFGGNFFRQPHCGPGSIIGLLVAAKWSVQPRVGAFLKFKFRICCRIFKTMSNCVVIVSYLFLSTDKKYSLCCHRGIDVPVQTFDFVGKNEWLYHTVKLCDPTRKRERVRYWPKFVTKHNTNAVFSFFTHLRSTQPCIPPESLNRVPASAGVRAGMSPLPGGR